MPPRLLERLNGPGTARWGEKVAPAEVHQSLAQLTDDPQMVHRSRAARCWARAPPSGRSQGQPRPGRGAIATSGLGSRIAIVPKGLRSFDANDSDFFLQLLPGPRDKDGLPESIRFWKHRIESRDDPSFTVGVIYGPSGCGKSSLVKAGLLPRLARRVVSVYVEATAGETEARI